MSADSIVHPLDNSLSFVELIRRGYNLRPFPLLIFDTLIGSTGSWFVKQDTDNLIKWSSRREDAQPVDSTTVLNLLAGYQSERCRFLLLPAVPANKIKGGANNDIPRFILLSEDGHWLKLWTGGDVGSTEWTLNREEAYIAVMQEVEEIQSWRLMRALGPLSVVPAKQENEAGGAAIPKLYYIQDEENGSWLVSWQQDFPKPPIVRWTKEKSEATPLVHEAAKRCIRITNDYFSDKMVMVPADGHIESKLQQINRKLDFEARCAELRSIEPRSEWARIKVLEGSNTRTQDIRLDHISSVSFTALTDAPDEPNDAVLWLMAGGSIQLQSDAAREFFTIWQKHRGIVPAK